MIYPSSYRINTPQITHQTIEGETIIIDFESGAYFSTDGVGAQIWEQIAQNVPVEEIHQVLIQQYPQTDPAEIHSHLKEFIAQLQREALIISVDPAAPRVDSSAGALPAAVPVGGDFQAPNIFKYTDMQDLLLLDPIHDVDEQGWPMKKEEGVE